MFRFRSDEKAEKFLLENTKGNKNIDDVVSDLLGIMPASSKDTYGKTSKTKAANYFNEVMLKNKVIDDGILLSGGGLFVVRKDCIIGSKGSMFTFIPRGLEGGMLVRIGVKQKEVGISNQELIKYIEDGYIIEKYLSKGKEAVKKYKTDSQQTKKEEKDFQASAKYLRKLLSEYGVKTIDEFIEETDMLLALMPEETLDRYPSSKEGQIVAVAEYVKENIEEVSVTLSSRLSLMKETENSGCKLDTGTVVFSTGDAYGIERNMLYVAYYDKEGDRFIFAPIMEVDLRSKVGKKVASVIQFGIASATTVAFIAAPEVMVAGSVIAFFSSYYVTQTAVHVGGVLADVAVDTIKGTNKFEVIQQDEEVDVVEIYLAAMHEELTFKPCILSIGRDALTKIVEQGIFTTDDSITEKLRYM